MKTAPKLQPVNELEAEVLEEYVRYAIGIEWRVPQAYTTDWASVPKWLWPWFPPHDTRYSGASVIHDYLYEYRLVDRALADRVFFCIMLADGTPPSKAWLMWVAVRLFGKKVYDT